jgi:carboxymethylenebutenolidase
MIMKILLTVLLIFSVPSIINAQEKPGYQSSDLKFKSGKDSVAAYFAYPPGEGPFPALIVIHEWWGLTDWIKGNADLLAKNGYAALAIDLYRGKLAENAEEAHEIMRALPEDRAARDLKSAFNFLASNELVDKEKIGSIGWCMGGSYSLMAAMNISDLAACVICYGRLVTEDESLEKIQTPVLGIFGENDRGIPAEDVKTFENALQEKGKDIKVVIYPDAGHGFMNSNNQKEFKEETTQKAWNEIMSFLELHLKE